MWNVTDEQFNRYLTAKPCPECGQCMSTPRHDDNGMYMHCNCCKHDTKSYPTLDGALKEWNKENDG